ncbi:DivIVA domain-containing protein [Micromonospora cremea]|uniref:DivIVA domain-containing protein n=1 Tax=Micromonospora cremea TaxID=709881 RepID=A0A1N5W7X4_9ACTN|nr:DivIVA domain-containing protein [Micromonospora cremea]SIM81089.1 DivIVA domain-containing protein [Micromonospora cremea]
MSVRSQRPAPANGDHSGRSGAYPSLLPWQVAERRFPPARFGRRGLDPDGVYAFLDRVAVDMAALHVALAESRREAARIEVMLHRCRFDHPPTGRGRGQVR